MPSSMTGYGCGDVTLAGRRFTVEIKSVNHRYNEISVKLPRVLNRFEDEVRKMVLAKVKRGKTDVYVTFETFAEDDVSINLNKPLALKYAAALLEMKEALSLSDGITLDLLKSFPDVLSVQRDISADAAEGEMREALSLSVSEALDGFTQMRLTEGAALTCDILQKLESIEENTEAIAIRLPDAAAEYKSRLFEKVQTALSGQAFDESRFIMEITLFADKSCVDEELTRLKSHISQMRQTLREDEQVGRKLDFLTQEMNREINTVASKSADISIAKLVVELKSGLEKIREQVQNIE